MKIKVELEQSDLDSLHDTIFNAIEIEDLTNEQLIEFWEILPEDIQSEAMRWGLDDSVVRDNIYVWLQKNKKD
jgi:hypothetical protein